MAKSIKLKNNVYIDSKGIDYKHTNLETTLDGLTKFVKEEQVIGTWIDGKPIYRLVKQVTKVSGKNLNIPLEKYNIDTLIRTYGFLNSNSGIVYGDLFRYETPEIHTRVIWYPEYNRAIFISGTDATSNGNVTVIFEYTKTTD